MSDRPRHLDAVVIGGGPAGALVARLLAGQGWSVVLAERGPRYRDTTCGHCLSPRGAELLSRAGLLGAVERVAAGRTRAARVHRAGRAPIACPLVDRRAGGGGLLVPRVALDQCLLDAAAGAGATVLQPASARATWSGDGPTTVTILHGGAAHTVTCGLLVGADGLGSPVARALGLGAARPGRKFGFSFEIDAGDLPPGSVEMFVVDGGYLGAVRQSDGHARVAGLVGAGRHRDPFAFARAVAGRFEPLRRLGLDRVERRAVAGFTAAGPMPWRPKRVASGRGALVGDAAGFVEPFTGEGMTWALEGATILAGITAEAAPGAWTRDMAERYHAAFARRVRRRQRACGWLAGCLERPAVREAIFAVAGRHRGLTGAIAGRVVGT